MDLGLPKKREDIVDMAIFDRKPLSDIDLHMFRNMYGLNCYKQLQDQLIPMVYRRVMDETSQNIQAFVEQLHEVFPEHDLESLPIGSRPIIRDAIYSDLSAGKLREESMNHKGKDYVAEDYYAFDVFLEECNVDVKYTMEQRRDAEMQALVDVMRGFNSRRFKYSQVENEAQSYEHSYFDAAFSRIHDNDLLGIVGLADADWMLYRIIRKRNITGNAWTMIGCIKAMAGRQYTEFTRETLND